MAVSAVEGVRQKLIRAEKHFAAVLGILHTFNKGHCKLIPERDEEINALVLRVTLEPKGSPELSAVIGDFLFNIRCVLDHLVCGIAHRAGHPITTKHMFPITFSQDSFDDAVRRRRLDGVPTGALAIIQRLQPYNSGNEPLRWLDRLHNADKHRALNVTTVASSHTHFVWGAGGFQTFLGAEELHDGAILPVGVPLNDPSLATLIDRLYEVKVEGECALLVRVRGTHIFCC